MKLKFKQQQYQLDATNAIVSVFDTQRRVDVDSVTVFKNEVGEFDGYFDEDIDVIANPGLNLDDSQLKKNVSVLQKKFGIISSDFSSLSDFSIEMETGTGKTYTYINSMYELNKKYGFSKFIVVVPSVAIREGVYKSFEVTAEHFIELYGSKIRCSIYNSSRPKDLTDFTGGSGIQCIIMNYQVFNSTSNDFLKIYEERDEFGSNSPIDLIKACKPIIIIDEPQKLSPKAETIINESFNPLFKLRFSATHKKEYNKIYTLDAVDAYNQKLVKKIEVIGLEVIDDKSHGTYIYVSKIVSKKTAPSATLEIEVKGKKEIKKKEVNVTLGDNLYYKSRELTAYKDNWIVSEINAHPNHMYIEFLNGQRININGLIGDADQTFRYRVQLKETIKSHIEKEKILFSKGIKVLSLFFIDKVKNYRDYEQSDNLGILAKLFEELYLEVISQVSLDPEYEKYLNSHHVNTIHNGYFSVDKKGLSIDSTGLKLEGGSSDVSAYDLILKNKERLLSFEEPTRFIFSHSALREGWDNPNVFQICTLKESKSEINKRQEIGRGLRICVNKQGERMDYLKLEEEFHTYNTLTVIASESYDLFTKSLQEEIAKDLKDKRIMYKDDVLFNKTLYNEKGMSLTITNDLKEEITELFMENCYFDLGTFEVTEKFKKAMKSLKVVLPKSMKRHTVEMHKLLDDEIFNRKFQIDNRGSKNINGGDFNLNDNFDKKEFQKLWSKINKRTTYEINFDSDVLITNALTKLNQIYVGRVKIRKTIGSQKEESSRLLLNESNQFSYGSKSTSKVSQVSKSNIKYDLLGEIKKSTGLKRSTIANALTQMDETAFGEYKFNPDLFISMVSEILNDEKATCVINEIKYIKLDKVFENKIFVENNINGQLNKDVFEVNKHIYDYVKVDSNVERDFALEIDNQEEVVVYVKLPSGFKISTPVGYYNPDWAMVIESPEIKYVYFIAETKGTKEIEDLKTIERLKIKCAIEHFKEISEENVHYGVVSTYSDLSRILEQI